MRGSSRAQRRNSRRQGEGRGKVGHGTVLLELFFFPLSAERAALREGKEKDNGDRRERNNSRSGLHLNCICIESAAGDACVYGLMWS